MLIFKENTKLIDEFKNKINKTNKNTVLLKDFMEEIGKEYFKEILKKEVELLEFEDKLSKTSLNEKKTVADSIKQNLCTSSATGRVYATQNW